MGQCLDQASSDTILVDFYTYMLYRRCIDMYHYSLVSIYIVSSVIISHGNGCIWSCNSTFYDNHFHLVLLELILYAHSQEQKFSLFDNHYLLVSLGCKEGVGQRDSRYMLYTNRYKILKLIGKDYHCSIVSPCIQRYYIYIRQK